MKKGLSFLLVLAMLLTMTPMSVFAKEKSDSINDYSGGPITLTLNCYTKVASQYESDKYIGTQTITLKNNETLSGVLASGIAELNAGGTTYSYDTWDSDYYDNYRNNMGSLQALWYGPRGGEHWDPTAVDSAQYFIKLYYNKEAAQTYTVSYNANVPEGVNVTGMPLAASHVTAGAYVLDNAARPTRAADEDKSYTFVGWATATGPSISTTVSSINVTDNTTVYALWKPTQGGPITLELNCFYKAEPYPNIGKQSYTLEVGDTLEVSYDGFRSVATDITIDHDTNPAHWNHKSGGSEITGSTYDGTYGFISIYSSSYSGKYIKNDNGVLKVSRNGTSGWTVVTEAQLETPDSGINLDYTRQGSMDAQYYIRKDGEVQVEPSNYPEGKYFPNNPGLPGKIYYQKPINNDDRAVETNLAVRPTDAMISEAAAKAETTYNPETQYIQWYVVKNAGNSWHVDGVIYNKAKATLTYELNGGGNGGNPDLGLIANIQYVKGSTVTVQTAEPVKVGYIFTGWDTDVSADDPVYTAGRTFTINDNTTLYAVWVPSNSISYTVVHHFQNISGSGYDSDKQAIEETKYGTTGAPVSGESCANSYGGFAFDHSDPATGTIQADGTLKFDLYYTITEQDMSGEVEAKNVTAVYDGKAHGIEVKAPTGAQISFKDGSETTNAGIKTVEYTVSKPGYKTVTGSAVITISQAAITVTAKAASKVIGGTDPEFGYDVTGTVNNETAAFGGKLARVAGEEAKRYDIQQGNLVLSNGTGFLADNYTLKFTKGIFTITEQDMSGEVEAKNVTAVYDGKAHGIEVKAPTGAQISFKDGSETTN
ncbi:MAG: MBG domain-containing protein, partial [Candidatus Cloacimonetes bacterium]|nr:MBG domain-containing protein [Candidatus Cloacimonadota bacterium]